MSNKVIAGILGLFLAIYIILPVVFMFPLVWIYGGKINESTVPKSVFTGICIFFLPQAILGESIPVYGEWLRHQMPLSGMST